MRNVASLDSNFDKNKQYNGVQLIQIIYEKRDTYTELIQQPERAPEPIAVSKPEPEPEPEPESFAVPRYAIESNQCAATLEAESLERMRVVVEINFSTIRGLVLLESDLALYADTENGAPEPEKWLEKMRTDWESRLHSEWLDEFMEALQLWVLSKI